MNTVRLGPSILARGKNLAVVLRYARKSPCWRVRLEKVDAPINGREYLVTFYFDDGAECATHWGDWRVLLDWLLARRSWGLDRVYIANAAIYDQLQSDPRVHELRRRGTAVPCGLLN